MYIDGVGHVGFRGYKCLVYTHDYTGVRTYHIRGEDPISSFLFWDRTCPTRSIADEDKQDFFFFFVERHLNRCVSTEDGQIPINAHKNVGAHDHTAGMRNDTHRPGIS